MNNVTLEEIKKLNYAEQLAMMHKYPFPSQWENKDALEFAEYTLCLIQGERYQQTGNLDSFKATNLK
jgi:hypothetical protein